MKCGIDGGFTILVPAEDESYEGFHRRHPEKKTSGNNDLNGEKGTSGGGAKSLGLDHRRELRSILFSSRATQGIFQ